ncbi:thiamine biosynthesis protein MoeB [Bacillus sp. HMF5848]|uniref:MoeB/ThiF family adenylyltransferase n=1 Tax=Bacillus sp. HMF5848 TaxID=2495421 RepID=UPI000F77E439|nr:MoeB/ThiF family adenylyltransferase [Bacillus sp. HMF5848]RSK27928.1 thiamine biosynthesis protein MoeB [Bacillus sp. HMF5848]
MHDRYSRQTLFNHIGQEGQSNLKKGHVLLIGAGALGTANAEMLVRGGIGKLTIVDRDYVEWSNLQRQQLYSEEDAENRLPKVVAAAQRLNKLNSDVIINPIIKDVGVQELEDLIADADVILDATDNFETRLIINDVAIKFNKPWVYGACVGSFGLMFTILPNETPCLQCLLGKVPLQGMTCDTVGIIAPAVQMVAAHQTAEVLKILVKDFKALNRKLISFDLWKNLYTAVNVIKIKSESCPSCGNNRTYPNIQFENQVRAVALCGRDTVQIRPPQSLNIELSKLNDTFIKSGFKTEQNPYLLSVLTPPYRIVVFRDGRMLVHGTNDLAKAKALYHRYIG